MNAKTLNRESELVTMPGAIPPMPAVARILARHDRENLEAFVTVAIDLLDVMGGDPDLDAQYCEDEISCRPKEGCLWPTGAGCPVSDPGGHSANEDEPESGSFYSEGGAGCVISDPDAAVDDRACDKDHEAI